MAKTLKFPLTIFLFLALAYIIPSDGVSGVYISWSCRKVESLRCYDCEDIASCNKPKIEDCKPDETICHVTELPLGTVIDRCCEQSSLTKMPGTCSGTGRGTDPKECYCNSDFCNLNEATATTTTTTTPKETTTSPEETTCKAGSTSAHGRTPFLIVSFASVFFILASSTTIT